MGPSRDYDRMLELADRQHDVFTHRQLRAIGWTGDAIKSRARSGRIIRVHVGVYASTRRLTRHGRWLAAVLAAGEGAVLCGLSAGALHGLVRGDGADVHVAVEGSAGRKRREGFRFRRTVLHPWERTTEDGIPTVTPARALLELSAGATPQRIARLIKRSHRLRIYDDREVRAVLDAHPRLPGAARLTRVLQSYREPPATKNELEEAMYAICDAIDRPRPLVNTIVEGYEVDFSWPQWRLIVETDGRDTHLTPDAFEDDRARDAFHTSLGYRVVRFTYRQVMYEPGRVTAVLRKVLARTAV